MSPRTVVAIDQNWQFKQEDKDDSEYLAVAQFPTMIHLDLMHHGLIPDPNIGKNELEVQWVGETSWVYKTTFASPSTSKGDKAILAFDGLDTIAEIYLNGKHVGSSDNMFVAARVDVTDSLKAEGETNELVINFANAFEHGEKVQEKHPDHKWACWNGVPSRMAVRKAQYHWGWDWGPMLMAAGPWRPVNLEIYTTRITDLYTDIKVEDSLRSAEVVAHAPIEGDGTSVRFDVSLNGEKVASETVEGSGHAAATFVIQNPKLWYPRQHGDGGNRQPLYTIKATLVGSDGKELDTLSKRIGLRKVELVQHELDGAEGTSFFFKVNNVPVFAGGSNWIPADNFIPRISNERYYDWVRLLVEGEQNILRVWGGGIYEEQALYDACDEMGIMVWQDFMFGCGNYPAHKEILDSIDKEARYNVARLRHHPSIVIWAGNNEDYSVAESEKLTYDFEDKDPQSWLKTDFPARYIYEHILSEACRDLCPNTFYHPGSPWGAGKDTSDLTVGDVHQWNVWHGKQEKYQDFAKLMGRFVSEFGMEAFPSIKTIDGFLPKGKDDPDRYPQSSTIDFHNKAAGHERRLALYLVENMRYKFDPIEDYIYCTQLMQAECLSAAYRLWRREWRGDKREYCGGAIVWQINDCWPVTSWSICDYHLRPKHAFFAIRREMWPVVARLERREAESSQLPKVRVWASNLTHAEAKVDCVVKFWDIETGDELASKTVASSQQLKANQTTDFDSLSLADVGVQASNDDVVIGVFLSQDGEQTSRYIDWPQPLKYLHFAKPKDLKVELVEENDGQVVVVSAEVPVKGLAVECEDDGVIFRDNLVDLVPGEKVKIPVEGAKKDTVFTTRCLNSLF
ncbi:glycoside hydrolase [Sarocladium strictum]